MIETLSEDKNLNLGMRESYDLIKDYLVNDGTFFEVGTFQGTNLNRAIEVAERCGKPFKHIYTCDSFEGLPDEDPSLEETIKTIPDYRTWVRGQFNLKEFRGLSNNQECVNYVKRNCTRKDVNVVVGWFKDSLTKELAEEVGKIDFLHIDCDIYISTLQTLEWVFTYDLLANNCLVKFDDWHPHLEYVAGEPLAFKEITEKYKTDWKRISMNLFIKG